jgi:hypothetical protein
LSGGHCRTSSSALIYLPASFSLLKNVAPLIAPSSSSLNIDVLALKHRNG